MQLYHDIPSSDGVRNAIRRARQLTTFQWAPLRDIPAGTIQKTPDGRKNYDIFLPAHRPQCGVLYSSVRIYEKYIGFNVSLETFATALANPNSVLYTRSLHGRGRSMYAYYGTVCSSFASYVCDLPFRRPCAFWPLMDGVSEVDSSSLENLSLCDIVLNPKQHIAIITDIQRDENGIVRLITVAESTTPLCEEKTFTPEQFRGHWLENGYFIFRYEGIHRVTYTPSPFVPVEGDPPLDPPVINRSLLPDFGNKANYTLGETVTFSVFEPEWDRISVTGADSLSLSIEEGAASFTPEKPGYYTACCMRGDVCSEPVEFGVTSVSLVSEKTVYKEGEPITIHIENLFPGDTPLGWFLMNDIYFAEDEEYFTEEQKASRSFTLSGRKPGGYVLILEVMNRYGRYKSADFTFRVE